MLCVARGDEFVHEGGQDAAEDFFAEFVVRAHGVFDLFFDVEMEHGGRWVRNMCFSIQDFSQRRKHGKLTKGTKNAKKCFEVFIL